MGETSKGAAKRGSTHGSVSGSGASVSLVATNKLSALSDVDVNLEKTYGEVPTATPVAAASLDAAAATTNYEAVPGIPNAASEKAEPTQVEANYDALPSE